MKNIQNNISVIFQCFLLILALDLPGQTYGCTDRFANNFNQNATTNDGSCTYDAASISPIKSWLLPELLNETSGLIWWNGKIWTHNDDTDINLYSLDTNDIKNYLKYPLISSLNIDWEEISQDSSYIYVGDFGNNVNGNRTNLKILRVEKVSLLQNSPIIDTINFSYSTQTNFPPTGSNNTNFDCEAFIVSRDSIYLFTKEWVSKKSSIYSLPKIPGTHKANFISNYDVQGLITGATYHEEKKVVVLCGYTQVLQPFTLLLYDFQNHDFFSGNKRKISINLPFTQVEGIATEDGLNYFISNERFMQSIITSDAKINLINLSDYLGHYLVSNVPNFSTIQKIDIYPNPVSDFINIKMSLDDLSDSKLNIFNSLGQILNSFTISSNEFKVDVRNYNKGFYYFVIISNDKYLMSSKFIKQ